MKVLICGSRTIIEYHYLIDALEMAKEAGIEVTHVISGGARGVDRMASLYATYGGLPLDVIYPDWDTYGKSAGFRRNIEMVDMADAADAVIAIWDGKSKGTKHSIDYAKKQKKPVILMKA